MGAKWQRIRSILNPRMLKPKHVSSYANTINDVVTDFTVRVAKLREASGDGVMVNDLAGELYKFAFEGQQRKKINDVSVMEALLQPPQVLFFPTVNWPKVFISLMQRSDTLWRTMLSTSLCVSLTLSLLQTLAAICYLIIPLALCGRAALLSKVFHKSASHASQTVLKYFDITPTSVWVDTWTSGNLQSNLSAPVLTYLDTVVESFGLDSW